MTVSSEFKKSHVVKKPGRRAFTIAAAAASCMLLLSACGSVGAPSVGGAGGTKAGNYRIGVIPKFTSDPYFVAVNEGAKEAAKEIGGIDITFNGPVNADVAAQSDIIDQFVQQKYDAITVSANDANALVPALKRASAAGVKVSTFDSDVAPEGREVFLNQTTFEGMGKTMVEMMAKQTGGKGNYLVVTAVLTAPNQNRWIEEMKKYMAATYPDMSIKAVLPGDEDLAKSRQVTLDYLRGNPDIQGVFAVTGIATPGVAEAVEQLGLKGKVAVTGLGVPSLIKPYVKSGTVKEAALWSPVDIGYGAVQMAHAQLKGTLDPAAGKLSAGRLGDLKFISKDVILLGEPLVFTKDNVDKYAF